MASELDRIKAENAQAERAIVEKINTKGSPEFKQAFDKHLNSGKSVSDAFEATQTERQAALSQNNAGATSSSQSSTGGGKKELPCPMCEGQILAKRVGRAFATISGFLQRSFSIRIPTSIISYLKERMPVSKASIFKDGCPACGGKSSIEDPSDMSAENQQVMSIAESKSKEILEAEKALAPACGNRYTLIQGCDLLEVGLGINDADSYAIDEEKGLRSKGLADFDKVDTKKAGPIPEGAKCNYVRGINSLASPGGHYMIKCSNKFSLITGAQGVEITSGGPVTISGGITRITGPEIVIGTSAGRLSLEGEVVDITGKSIEFSPTNGHLFVKGTISNTGNIATGGHMHAESVSFVSAECTGKNEPSKISASSDLYVGPAFWGGLGVEGITAALKDLVGYTISKLTNPVEAPQVLTPRFFESVRDKVLNISYLMRPIETMPTGWILPGTCVVVGPMGVAVNPNPVPVYNYPHTHALPDGSHVHETRIPNIDCSADSASEVRSKQCGVMAGAPLHKTSTTALQAALGLFELIGSVFVGVWKAIQGFSGPYSK